ncbi:hypothetical protein NA655_10370 [Pseudomonas kuykendallii]|uniref:hypothetical protein n=1 Tax=Pseudomonas kuykendallii TaxID=1007099 RepID=UPI00111447A3|nr:hypothetical protein [Pseudomonas kuykendallii]MCQ4271426.1 hypothetical protein [Pseudomonas kuykendallii]
MIRMTGTPSAEPSPAEKLERTCPALSPAFLTEEAIMTAPEEKSVEGLRHAFEPFRTEIVSNGTDIELQVYDPANIDPCIVVFPQSRIDSEEGFDQIVAEVRERLAESTARAKELSRAKDQ